MPIEVTGPDGKVHSFPDGSSHDQINQQMTSVYGGAGSLQPTGGLPRTGDPTAASGAVMPGMGDFPAYATPEDRTNIALSMILPRGSIQALQNTPGHVNRIEYAKKVGDQTATLEDRQRVGLNILRSYAQLRNKFDAAPDEVVSGAIGPRNVAELNETSPTFLPFTNIPIPGLSGPTTVDPKTKSAITGNITPVQRAAILNPDDPKAAAAWNLQNLLGHDVHGITTALMAGGGKGMQMSDVRQKAFDSAMRDFMQSGDRKSASEILDHAKGLIANDFNIPMDVADAVIKQHIGEMQKQASNKKPDPDRLLLEARNALSMGAPRDKVIERLQKLGVNPSGL